MHGKGAFGSTEINFGPVELQLPALHKVSLDNKSLGPFIDAKGLHHL